MFEPLSAAQLTNHTDDDDDNDGDGDEKRAPFSTDAIPSMASFGSLREAEEEEEEAGGEEDRRRGNGCININERTNLAS